MGYRLNRLDEPVFMAVSKPLLTEFGIYHRLESCELYEFNSKVCPCGAFAGSTLDYYVTLCKDNNVKMRPLLKLC